jgi:hypothetical protein
MKDSKYHQGKYKPINPNKYDGDSTNIIFRSSYERKFMSYCDLTEEVISWKSEEFFIPYRSPIDGKVRRYFPDFFIKYKDKNNNIRKVVIEVKPKKDLNMPNPNPKRKTKSWAYSVKTWAVNQEKWKAAEKWCKEKNYEFKIMTEADLF